MNNSLEIAASTITLSDLPDSSVSDNLEYYKTCAYHWLYSGRSHGWWHYSKNNNIALENLYRSGPGQSQLTINNKTYSLNFVEMTQRENSSARNILRVESLEHIALTGIDGSRIQKCDIINFSQPPPQYVDVAPQPNRSQYLPDVASVQQYAAQSLQ